MNVGELERRSGVGRHALRYYEQLGLIVAQHRVNTLAARLIAQCACEPGFSGTRSTSNDHVLPASEPLAFAECHDGVSVEPSRCFEFDGFQSGLCLSQLGSL